MKKKIYYTINANNTDTLGYEYKTVTVYEIINNEPKCWFNLDLAIEDNTKEEIQNYLDDNGYSDDEFEMILL